MGTDHSIRVREGTEGLQSQSCLRVREQFSFWCRPSDPFSRPQRIQFVRRRPSQQFSYFCAITPINLLCLNFNNSLDVLVILRAIRTL